MISYAQNLEDVMLARVFRDKPEGFYIDVGAMDPERDSVTKHFYDSGWSGINVEPNPQFHARLVAERPRDKTLAICVGEEPGIATFHVFENEGISTLDPKIAEHFAHLDFHSETIQVPVSTLASILAEAPAEIDFLKIDVEGWELSVLRSNDWTRYRPTVVLVEAVDPETHQPSWEPWEPMLLQNGYLFVYFDGLNRFYLREDRADLRDRFATPPNVFDGYERAAVWAEHKTLREHLESTYQALQAELAHKATHEEWAAHVTHRLKEASTHYDHLLKEFEALRAMRESEWEHNRVATEALRTQLQAEFEKHEKAQKHIEHLTREFEAARVEVQKLGQKAEEARRETTDALYRLNVEQVRHQELVRNLEAEAAAAQAARERLITAQREIEELRREYLNQRLWAGQLAQEKAEVITRLRQLEQASGEKQG